MTYSLTICTISRDHMHAHTSACLNKVFTNLNILSKFTLHQKMIIGCSVLHTARSIALSEWYQHALIGDYFLFIDADQVFTVDDVLTAIDYSKKTESDVVCGGYPRHDGKISSKPKDLEVFSVESHGELKYGATGFMLITKPILDRMDLKPVYVDQLHPNVIPYFQPKIVVDVVENMERNIWLAEDYSFCWTVTNNGGKIWGFMTPTLGHILTETKYLSC